MTEAWGGKWAKEMKKIKMSFIKLCPILVPKYAVRKKKKTQWYGNFPARDEVEMGRDF